MAAYGATFDLTPREKGMPGAIERAKELAASTPKSWIPQQFENEANIEIHKKTTAKEIQEDFPEGLDFIITGVGTGGHITGVAEVLKKIHPNLKVFAVEPAASPVISAGNLRRIRYRELEQDSFRRIFTCQPSTALFKSQKKKRTIMHNVQQGRREFSSEFQQAHR